MGQLYQSVMPVRFLPLPGSGSYPCVRRISLVHSAEVDIGFLSAGRLQSIHTHPVCWALWTYIGLALWMAHSHAGGIPLSRGNFPFLHSLSLRIVFPMRS